MVLHARDPRVVNYKKYDSLLFRGARIYARIEITSSQCIEFAGGLNWKWYAPLCGTCCGKRYG